MHHALPQPAELSKKLIKNLILYPFFDKPSQIKMGCAAFYTAQPIFNYDDEAIGFAGGDCQKTIPQKKLRS